MSGLRLTDEEYRHVAEHTTLLRLHGALILGIVDPTPMPSPMSEEEGRWVREHAWTDGLCGIENAYPWGFHRWCSCQSGTCWPCSVDRCDRCVTREHGGPRYDEDAGSVTTGDGFVVARIVHRDDQRPCRSICVCTCPKTGPAPARRRRRRAAAPTPRRTEAEARRPGPESPVQLALELSVGASTAEDAAPLPTGPERSVVSASG